MRTSENPDVLDSNVCVVCLPSLTFGSVFLLNGACYGLIDSRPSLGGHETVFKSRFAVAARPVLLQECPNCFLCPPFPQRALGSTINPEHVSVPTGPEAGAFILFAGKLQLVSLVFWEN